MTLSKRIFNISNEDEFNSIALEVFDFQYKNIPVYKKYVDLIQSQKKSINHYKEIPFLPIDFFKSNHIIADNSKIEKTFLSSGTGNTMRSKHLVKDLELYEQSFSTGYEHFYSDPKEWTILALLPSYLDQGDSSLIYMVNNFINKSENPESNYIKYDLDVLKNLILKLKDKNVLLIGVSYALLELSELGSFNFENWVIMETGGMKGRRREMVRQELHQQLKKAFNVDAIHSE